MKTHSEDYKEEIKNLGKQQDVLITYTINNELITLNTDNIISVTPHYKASLLKSVMKQLDIESDTDIPRNTLINFKHGILINGEFEYLDFGNYIVFSSDKKEDSNSFEIICYDKMIYSMKDYEPLGLTYPVTVKTYLATLCAKLGYGFTMEQFANADKELPRDLFENINYTYRDVLDDMAEATGSTIYIDLNGNLVLGQPNETNDTIDEEYLKDINVNFGEKYGPVNCLVLSRSAGSDNIYYPEQLPENPVTIKISDNQIMNQNNRSEYMSEIFNNINGLEYYLNDFKSTGIIYYDLLDKYNVRIGENTYNCLMLNDEVDITQGIEEIIYSDAPETSETDYTKADKTDQKINQVTLIVDKQEQRIEALVSSNTDLVQKAATLRMDVDRISGEIGEIADVTKTLEGHGAVETTDINESEPILIRIYPTLEDITPLYPSHNLYPHHKLYLHRREIYFKRVNEAEADEHYEIQYNLPCNLYKLNDVYDEFVLDYETQQCYVIHRVGKNANGEKYLLDLAYQENFDYPEIHLLDGDYKIIMPAFENAYIYVRLMAKNIYTSQFATKVELNSKIEQTSESITLDVTKKLKNYSTTQEMNATIQLTATGITSTVANTYETKANANTTKTNLQSQITQNATNINLKVSKNNIISEINQTAEEIKISASKLNLSGYVTVSNLSTAGSTTINGSNITTGSISANRIAGGSLSLTGGNTTITSTNFSVTKDGAITAKSGTIGGWTIGTSGIASGSGTSYVKIDSNSSTGTAIWCGAENAANAPFRVLKNGKMYCTGAVISGYATEAGLSGGTTTISGNCLKTGTIDASQVTVKNINASNITSGTINASNVTITNLNASNIKSGTITADRISGGTLSLTNTNTTITSSNLSVDKNGKLKCTEANVTGTIQATGGYFNGDVYLYGNHVLNSYNSNNQIAAQFNRYGVYFYTDGIYRGQITASTSNWGTGVAMVTQYNQHLGVYPGRVHTNEDIYSDYTMYAQDFRYISRADKKKDIVRYQEKAISKVVNTDIYTYKYIDSKDDRTHIGFVIGDEYRLVEEIHDENSVDVSNCIGIMWKALQELTEKIERLEAKV